MRTNAAIGALKAQHAAEFSRLERDKINLQSTLPSQEVGVVEANRRMLTLRSALKTKYDTEVTRLLRDKSDLHLVL